VVQSDDSEDSEGRTAPSLPEPAALDEESTHSRPEATAEALIAKYKARMEDIGRELAEVEELKKTLDETREARERGEEAKRRLATLSSHIPPVGTK
jgi:hypothetical protein